MTNYFKIVILFYGYSLVFCDDFPANIPRCRAGDVDCMVIVINELIRTGRQQGHPELNVPPVDPFQWQHPVDIHIAGNKNSPFKLNIHNSNVSFVGLGLMKATKIVGFGKDPKISKFEIYAKTPKLDILANYQATAELLQLPVSGHGYSNCTLENLECSFKLHPHVETRNGEEYLLIDKVQVVFNTTRFYMHFDTPVQNQKMLADTVNQVINDSWRELLEDVREIFEKAMANSFQSIVQPIFAKIPYRKFYLE